MFRSRLLLLHIIIHIILHIIHFFMGFSTQHHLMYCAFLSPDVCAGDGSQWTSSSIERLQAVMGCLNTASKGHVLHFPLSFCHSSRPWPCSTHQLQSGMCSFRCLPGPSSGSCVLGSHPHSGAGSLAGCGGHCGGACGHKKNTSH